MMSHFVVYTVTEQQSSFLFTPIALFFTSVHKCDFSVVLDKMETTVVCFQFLLIFRKAAAGELKNDGLMEVYRHMREVDVDAEGVKGAKNFFEAKVCRHCAGVLLHFQCCIFSHVQIWKHICKYPHD